jgi:hypothetical protein
VSTVAGMVSLFGHDPAEYAVHPMHAGGAVYTETNCYTDIIVELLHARGDEPLAAMGSVLQMDFEGDQWTFFKPAPEDMETLLGVDIHEMQPYRPLPLQAAEQIMQGRTIIVELDSYYLPDTASTSYRTSHVKSSVAVEAIDPAAEKLHYFHNAGLYELDGEDYRGVFRLGRDFSDDVLPPYTELARFDESRRLQGDELRAAAAARLRHHLSHRPATNPFPRFGAHLESTLPALLEGDAQTYHDYAFATVRMVGAGYEVAANLVQWMFGDRGAPATEPFRELVEGSKVLSFRMARRRAFDPRPALDALAEQWDLAMARLDALLD